MDQKDREGLDYKKELVNLIESGKLKLADLNGNIIDLSNEEENEEPKSENIPAKSEQEEEEEECDNNFQSKFLGMKKKLDDFPIIIAKLNTELNMMTKAIPAVGSLSSDDENLEAFIWKFNISFEWNNKNICLPISSVEDIKTLDEALTDEKIHHDVVCFNSYILFSR